MPEPVWNNDLRQATALAQSSQFESMLHLCARITESCGDNLDALLDVGALYFNYGFLDLAGGCFKRISALAPNDLRGQINLANVARDSGDHSECRRMYARLKDLLPNNAVIRRNALISHEYDPEISDGERYEEARAWGRWASSKADSEKNIPRPPMRSRLGRKLRIGYLSADLCQHTVGLFVAPVLRAHDHTRFEVFAYGAGPVQDWVTEHIQSSVCFKYVAKLDDFALAECIRKDEIDILIDLSGHTAGSRLTVFAHRPAPVQVSWLGYFATTGLSAIDAIVMDAWHAPVGAESGFTETVIRLPSGRFCYQPILGAPDAVIAPPCLQRGYVTFGCFNNTGKLNADVLRLWAQILSTIPSSRLILKWMTFNDYAFRQKILRAFARLGVVADRIELRGPSSHAALLAEYNDVDIALDPFPFTGGLTSCEAMWQGVPVVTWPQSRAVSRQTYALLCTIGLEELAAQDERSYVDIAVNLALNAERLTTLRKSMRQLMSQSALMNVQAFTRGFEQAMLNLYDDIYRKDGAALMSEKLILHVGPGHRQNSEIVPPYFQSPSWREIRFDIDPANTPDILGSITNLEAIDDESVDAIYSSHNIEHIYAYEVPVALNEFLRVLKPDGILVLCCPDLQSVCGLAAEEKLTDPIYTSQAGPISPLDIIYGHGAALAAGQIYMAHKCGFTLRTLIKALQDAGFMMIAGKRIPARYELSVAATKNSISEQEMRDLAGKVLA